MGHEWSRNLSLNENLSVTRTVKLHLKHKLLVERAKGEKDFTLNSTFRYLLFCADIIWGIINNDPWWNMSWCKMLVMWYSLQNRKECIMCRQRPSVCLSVCLSVTCYQKWNCFSDFSLIWFSSSVQKLLRKHKFRENCLCDARTLLKGVNEFLYILSVYTFHISWLIAVIFGVGDVCLSVCLM